MSTETESVQIPSLPTGKLGEDSVLIRIFLVRHGETEANREKMVVGQGDSELTTLGVQQAKALAGAILSKTFDKYVVSDLERTRHTSRLLQGKAPFVVDSRLREMAKGAREGYPKSLSYEVATRLRRIDENQKMPLLESNEDVWKRVSDWLIEIIIEATSKDRNRVHHPYSVLAVTHAGVIRTICSKLVPDQLPETVDVTDMGADGSTQSHLVVPNTSVTVLDLLLEKKTKEFIRSGDLKLIQPTLRLLTWHEHLSNLKR